MTHLNSSRSHARAVDAVYSTPVSTREGKRLWTFAAIAIVIVVAVGFLLQHSRVDQGLSRALNTLDVAPVQAFIGATYSILEPAGSIVLTLIVAAIIWWRHRSLLSGLLFGLTIALTWLPTGALKFILNRPRPDASVMAHPFLPTPLDGSYPSGHMAFVTAFVIALMLLARTMKSRAIMRAVAIVVVIVVALLLAISTVHFPTDILASVLWSMAVAPAVLWTLRYLVERFGVDR